MDDRSDVAELIHSALLGEGEAWESIVNRYTPLLMSVLRGYRLRETDVSDIAQTVWLRLVEHLGDLRQPRALPGWLITTARNEAIKTLKSNVRSTPVDQIDSAAYAGDVLVESIDDDLLRTERREALLEAFADLCDRDRDLLILLSADPAIPYVEISRRLNIPIGSIGPTRARALAKLRTSQALVALSDAPTTVTGKGH